MSMSADGSNKITLRSSTKHAIHLAYSPDGSKIIFERASQIYVMNSDGSTLVKMTDNEYGSWEPNISREGTKIYFNSSRKTRDRVYCMNLDGSNQVSIDSTHCAYGLLVGRNY